MKSIRSKPAVRAAEGDDRIRTGVPHFCTSESEPLRSASGFVYFLRDQLVGGPVKIGYSSEPQRRCDEINRRLKHESLSVIGCFPGTRDEERALHARWSRHRVIGEWFRPSDEILRAADLCRLLHAKDSNSGSRATC